MKTYNITKSEEISNIFIPKEDDHKLVIEDLYNITKSNISVTIKYYIILENKCDLLIKTSLNANQRSSNSKALIKINVLQTSDCDAEINPDLLIESNNVEIDHTVTIGSLPKETMLFMKSRGFNKEQTISIIKNSLKTLANQ